PGRVYASAQLGEFRLGKTDPERADSGLIAAGLLCDVSHGYAPPSRGPDISRAGHDADLPTCLQGRTGGTWFEPGGTPGRYPGVLAPLSTRVRSAEARAC